jgi:hypothetical protein
LKGSIGKGIKKDYNHYISPKTIRKSIITGNNYLGSYAFYDTLLDYQLKSKMIRGFNPNDLLPANYAGEGINRNLRMKLDNMDLVYEYDKPNMSTVKPLPWEL